MDNNLTPFQAITFAILIVLIIGGVAVFAIQRNNPDPNEGIPVTMWGTVSKSLIDNFQNSVNAINKDSLKITYNQYDEEIFSETLLEALASGIGPDIILLDDDSLIEQKNKLYKIGYDFYPQVDFKNNFIEASEILIESDGLTGIPFMIDPLVLYWNRTILNNEGISIPPEYWDQFLLTIPGLVDVDSSGNINKAGVALGEFRNVKNAKEIFVTLVRQAGNPIIIPKTETDGYESILGERLGFKTRPADAAINFFTQFSNPSKEVYSWNRSLPSSDEMFISGDLAFYIGYASERQDFINKNPNLNFGVSIIPQSRATDENITNGKLHFLTINNRTPNVAAAFSTISKIVSKENMGLLNQITDLPPIRRDLLGVVPESDYKNVFNRSALISKIFIDPNPIITNDIFQSMIESVISGRNSITDSINRANQELNDLLK